ncbi:MAG: hypothetical protein WBV74_10445 [Pseudonocardiaceae bacterium]
MTDEAGMIVATDRVGRKRWTDELRGPLQGSVGLPARLFWSGPSPYEVRWDLTDPIRRRDYYEIVLVEGTLDDVRELINGGALLRLWDQMYLSSWSGRRGEARQVVAARRRALEKQNLITHRYPRATT